MKCPNCGFNNPDGSKFCRDCGASLKQNIACLNCGSSHPPGSKFCTDCGHNLRESDSDKTFQHKQDIIHVPDLISDDNPSTPIVIESERKYVTVLFSDLTGYTAMSEKLDPEEVKEITSNIFGKISKIVTNYDGFIEKYAGDAVMAVFGAPKSHEDDPIRAIIAAREIHQVVNKLSPDVKKRIGQSISMHTGINTGLVVTGEVDLVRGTHGIAGDTINLAARLSSLAAPGEILVDVDTCRKAEGLFNFEYKETTNVKGKTEPVKVYEVLSQKDKPVTIRRLSGLRADLVGRKIELGELTNALKNLKQGKGRIFSICGGAGTGKSRLVEEVKATLDINKVQWIEGHAYAYSKNIPYFPLIDLLNRLFYINENDPSEKVKEKLESGIESLVANKEDVIPYLGVLYSLKYPGTEDISPEHLKSLLQIAVLTILSALAQKAPTVFFLEDLHWADLPFVEMIRRACMEIRHPAIVLCAYRPSFSLLTGHQMNSIRRHYHEIHLQDLSLSEAHDMLESLLGTGGIPPDLNRWIQSKTEGNPFYLEELVNSLIDANILIRDNGNWKLTKTITETDIPSSLHGLISGRLDRLEAQTKRILQEASVIGRDFLYEILKRITTINDRIDSDLGKLERLDLIRTRSFQPDLEYMFKHVLTQEIAYTGLLKKQRKEIHEKSAQVMETIFNDRLPEFYETLAFHFSRGHSIEKAVDYLVKSGEKSLARYAVEEAHQYFKQAYDLLVSKGEITEPEKIVLIDLLNSWGYAFYYLGETSEAIALFKRHQLMADSLDDEAKIGMFYAWLGIAHYMGGKSKDAYDYLIQSLELGEKTGNQKVIGYACTWLTWACSELGLFTEGIDFGEKAQKIAPAFPSDPYLFFKSLGGICLINYYKGDVSKVLKGAKCLLDYGERTANSRSNVFGHWMNGMAYIALGDMESGQQKCEKAIEAALDPAYPEFPKVSLGIAYFLNGQFNEAQKTLLLNLDFCEKHGMELIVMMDQCFLAPIWIAKGRMKQGAELLEKTRRTLLKNHRKMWYAYSEYILGEVNLQIATGPKPTLSIMAKNIGFLVKSVPFASKKAEEHLTKAIKLLEELGANGLLGQSYLSLGLLYKADNKTDKSRQCTLEAIRLFEKYKAKGFLKQANEVLDSLK
jgi:class 3 adenylate cyclase/tetratricopeptide (TPR) repeat protein